MLYCNLYCCHLVEVGTCNAMLPKNNDSLTVSTNKDKITQSNSIDGHPLEIDGKVDITGIDNAYRNALSAVDGMLHVELKRTGWFVSTRKQWCDGRLQQQRPVIWLCKSVLERNPRHLLPTWCLPLSRTCPQFLRHQSTYTRNPVFMGLNIIHLQFSERNTAVIWHNLKCCRNMSGQENIRLWNDFNSIIHIQHRLKTDIFHPELSMQEYPMWSIVMTGA